MFFKFNDFFRKQDSSIGFEAPVRANMRGNKLINGAITSSLLETVQDILKNSIPTVQEKLCYLRMLEISYFPLNECLNLKSHSNAYAALFAILFNSSFSLIFKISTRALENMEISSAVSLQ